MSNQPEIVFFDGLMRIKEIDFGIVPIGETKTKDIIVKNLGDVEIAALEFFINHPDIKIIQSPLTLAVGEERHLILEYTPKYQTDKGLNIKVKVRGVYIV